ncbi:MAG: hypothetical protein FWF10_04800 [Clostridiales bacterium]|nr:hypothetical protein [Clostridiales bacterium]
MEREATAFTQTEQNIIQSIQSSTAGLLRKAKHNYTWFVIFSTLSFAFPLLVPIFTMMKADDVVKILITSFAVAGSVASGLMTRLKLHENCIRIRSAAIQMRDELFDYQTESGDFHPRKADDPRKALKILRERCNLIEYDAFDETLRSFKKLAEEKATQELT